LGTVISKRISKALGKNVANNVDEVASDIVPKFKPQELNNLESFSSSSKFAELLIQNNITETELHVLIMSNIDNLTNDEKTVLKIFREAVSMPTNDTIIQKVIPVNDIDKYLTDTDPYNTIGGCVAKLEDVKHLGNMDEIYDALRLDYSNTKFVKDGDYAVIRFMTDEVDKMNIPYSSKFENSLYIKHDINYPQTGNGFTSAKDGSLIPEFEAKGFMIPNDGAELYKVSNGVEELIAIYDEDLMRFISILSD
jgi:hypothetical protein